VAEPGANKAGPTPPVGSTAELRLLGAGTQLGRYTLLRRIAAGGMAEVYAARSRGISGFEKKVAIKKILPQHAMNKRFVDMLVDEAKITVSLAHPNIAQIYELGLDDETYYMVMEFVEGRPLNRLLQKVDARGHRTMPLEHAVHIVAETAKGLHHAHVQRDHRGKPLGIVHRDVSPQNVMIAYSGDVKLIDFGIARARGRAAQTTVGTIKGKLRYLAPEIAIGLEPDHRADVFCAGIVLFELLTGEAMFAPRTDVEAIEMASEARVRSPRAQNPDVPRELDDIVMKALARERDDRFQSAKDLHTELRRFLNQYFPAYVGSELGDYMQSLFQAEVEEDRRLDGLAEKVVEKRASEPPPPALADAELPRAEGTKSGGYRELVTRSEIDLVRPVDTGGEAAQDPETIHEKVSAGDTAETVAHPPSAPLASLTPRPAPLRADPPTAERARAPIALMMGIFLFAAGGLFLLRSSDGGPEPAPRPSGAAAAISEPARVRIDISPEVPVRVLIDGELQAHNVTPPVRVRVNVGALTPVAIRIEARGYKPKILEQTLSPGNETVIATALEPERSAVELVGPLSGAKVEADHGRVEGTRITDLEFGQTVHIKVRRPGARDFETNVAVDELGTIRVEIPAAVNVPKGTLYAASRPISEVFVDGRSVGQSPVTLQLPGGSYTVTFKREGLTERRVVKISPNQRIEVLVQGWR